MKKNVLLLLVQMVLCATCFCQTKSKNVALLLGSANLPTLEKRVNILSDLYRIKRIDKIIVSGGCGAHTSSICEATEMKNRLVAKGIPENIIYKEENSKTTVQNYIFSRILRDDLGERIIQPNDSVFVVSDHWHAISVAARFNKYDHVFAKFFIEGDLVPTETALLDYGGLFNGIKDNNDFILKGTWPTPDAVYQWKGSTNYIFLDRIYSIKNSDTAVVTVNKLSQVFTSSPKDWENIDAVASDHKNNTLLVFKDRTCQIYFEKKDMKPLNLNLSALIIGLPAEVNYIDACFIKDNDLYLFAKSKVIFAKRAGKTFKVYKTEDLKSLVTNWPYAWGKGNLSAADYNEQEKTVYLYKNEQFIKLNEKTHLATEPTKLNLKWKDIN